MVNFCKAANVLKLTEEEKHGLNLNQQLERRYKAVIPIHRKENPDVKYLKIRKPIDRTMARDHWNSTNTIEVQVPQFDGSGTQEDIIDTAMKYDKLLIALSLNTNIDNKNVNDQRKNLFEEVMDGPARTFFQETYKNEVQANAALAPQDRLHWSDVLSRAIQLTIMEYFGDHPLDAYNNQLHYLNAISMGNMDPKLFSNRVAEISKKIPYCPSNLAGPAHPLLTAQQHINILHSASHRSHITKMRNAGKQKTNFGTNVMEFRNYLHDLYVAEYDQRVLASKKEETQGGQKKRSGSNGHPNGNNNNTTNNKQRRFGNTNQQERKYKNNKNISQCPHCNKFHPGAGDGCWTLDKNKDQRPEGYKKPGKTSTEMVQSLKSNHDTLAEMASDKKCLKISSHIHHTKNPSDATQALKQQNKRKRIEFVQQPKVADTDYNVGCEYANPLVALFEDKDQQDSINELDSDFDGYRFNLPEFLNPFFDREHLQKKTKSHTARLK